MRNHGVVEANFVSCLPYGLTKAGLWNATSHFYSPPDENEKVGSNKEIN